MSRNNKCDFTGPTGSDGLDGRKGDRGIQGPNGLIGCTGNQGCPGIKGNTGCTGSVGLRGPNGKHGMTGEKGPNGPRGLRGHQGPQGEKGKRGHTGSEGERGRRGNRGPQGCPGPTGPKGCTGPQGSKGDPGWQGPIGRKGETGCTGGVGPDGPQGNVGPSGPKMHFYVDVADSKTGSIISGPVKMTDDDTLRIWSDTLDVNVTEGSAMINIETFIPQDGGVGPTGPAGPNGADGPIGDKGEKGESDINCEGPNNNTVFFGVDQGDNVDITTGSSSLDVCKMECVNGAFNMVSLKVPNTTTEITSTIGTKFNLFNDNGDNPTNFILDSECRPACTLRFSYKYEADLGDSTEIKHGRTEIDTSGNVCLYSDGGDFNSGDKLLCNTYTYCASPEID